MDRITRRLGGVKKEYLIYSKEEADKAKIPYKYWKEATPGDWALSDDDFVFECVREVGPYTDKKGRTRVEKVFSIAKRFPSNTKFNYLEYKATGAWGLRSPRTRAEEDAGRGRSKRAVKAYVTMMMENAGEVDWDALGQLYRPKQAVPRATVKRFIRQTHVQQMIADELIKYMENAGITPGGVLKSYQEVYDAALDENQLSVAKGVVDKYAEMLDMKPDKVTITGGMSQELDWQKMLDEGDDAAIPQIENE